MKSWKTVILAGSQYLALATQLITGPLIARELGPQDRGVLATILVVYALLPVVVGFGTNAHFRALAVHGVASGRAYRWLIGRTWISLLVSASLSVPLFWVFTPDTAWELWIVFLLLGTSGMATYRNSVLAAAVVLGRLQVVSRNSILNGFITLSGITVLFATQNLTLASACAVYLCAGLVSTVVLLCPLVWEDTGGSFSLSVRYSLTSVPGQIGEIGLTRIDQLIVAVLLGPLTAGYYAVAFSYAYMLYPLLHTMSLRTVAGLNSREANPWKHGKSFLLLIAITGGGVLALLLLAPFVISFLFGPLYVESVAISQILLLAIGLMGLSVFFIQMNASRARANETSIAAIAGVASTLLLGCYLAPLSGAHGVAWAAVIGVLVNLIILSLLSRGNLTAKHRK